MNVLKIAIRDVAGAVMENKSSATITQDEDDLSILLIFEPLQLKV